MTASQTLLASYHQRIARIRANRTAGASELVREALALLLDLAAELSTTRAASRQRLPGRLEYDPKPLLVLLRTLQQAQPTMAPLINLGGEALQLAETPRGNRELAAGIRGLVRHWKRRGKRYELAAGETLRVLLAGARHVVTYSRSGTVLDALRFCHRAGLRFRISTSQGSPQMEGVAAAQELAEMGYDVALTTDAGLFGLLKGADALLIGADAVIRGGIVNKLGTYALARAARRLEVPVYAVCGPDKFLLPCWQPLLCIRHGAAKELLPGRLRGGLQYSHRLHIFNPYFELIPLRCITGVIANAGNG